MHALYGLLAVTAPVATYYGAQKGGEVAKEKAPGIIADKIQEKMVDALGGEGFFGQIGAGIGGGIGKVAGPLIANSSPVQGKVNDAVDTAAAVVEIAGLIIGTIFAIKAI